MELFNPTSEVIAQVILSRFLSEHLADCLRRVGYESNHAIHLIEGIHEFQKWRSIPEEPLDERYRSHMDAGDEFRAITERADAVAMLGVNKITQDRKARSGDEAKPARKTAYILRSLKRPEEVQCLREIYGKNFVLIAAFSARESRRRGLAREIARSRKSEVSAVNPIAEQLIGRDQKDMEKYYGQSLREAFALADFFVNADERKLLRDQIYRIVELIFGNVFLTPTPDEYGMFHAWAASLRSASLARQVGAAIATSEGEIVALGCNEVPKAGGGQYWPSDVNDRRDYIRGYDSNDHIKIAILSDIFKRLKRSSWLSDEKATKDEADLVKEALDDRSNDGLGRSEILNITEYGREVHAEMASLMAAVRQGIPVQGKTLFTTTFPCHNCAKHIIAAGIARVVYVEPYPKSRALELHDDAIRLGPDKGGLASVCFEPFVGVSPRQYFDLFSLGQIARKDANGVTEWNKHQAVPRLRTSPLAYIRREQDAILVFEQIVSTKGLQVVENPDNLEKQ